MKTIVRNVENKDNKEAIREAAGLLREGKLVAFSHGDSLWTWRQRLDGRGRIQNLRGKKGDPLTILSSFISGAWR